MYIYINLYTYGIRSYLGTGSSAICQTIAQGGLTAMRNKNVILESLAAQWQFHTPAWHVECPAIYFGSLSNWRDQRLSNRWSAMTVFVVGDRTLGWVAFSKTNQYAVSLWVHPQFRHIPINQQSSVECCPCRTMLTMVVASRSVVSRPTIIRYCTTKSDAVNSIP